MIGSLPARPTINTAGVLVAFALCGTGCVSPGQTGNPDEAPTGYGITFYEPFDNSRDFGPGYLAAPPPGTLHYEHDDGRGSEQHPLVHRDTNGTPPSIPDATRSPQSQAADSRADSSPNPTN